jgi:pilus assembly protein CpaB
VLRRSPRAVVLWGAALAVAVLTATIVAGDLATLHRRAAALGPERGAVVATRDLRIGDAVTGGDLALRRVHSSQLPGGVLTAVDRAAGRVVAVPVLRGQFVTERNLAPRDRNGLDGVVPPGMRAMRVVVTNALRPRPGASVDVLATFDAPGSAASPAAVNGAPSATVVIAAGVLVLTTDPAPAVTDGERGHDTFGITLLVDPTQALRLAYAESTGVVTLALVPPEDSAGT